MANHSAHSLAPIATVYDGNPIPPIPRNTTYFEGGNITFAVEIRALDRDAIAQSFREGSTLSLDEQARVVDEIVTQAEEAARAGSPQSLGGVAIHVFDASTGEERLRFDAFDELPHYHYLDPGVSNAVVAFDAHANGDPLDWTLNILGTRIAELLDAAGAGHLVAGLNPDAVAVALRATARFARARRRSLTPTAR